MQNFELAFAFGHISKQSEYGLQNQDLKRFETHLFFLFGENSHFQ
jgi:hypothetical protein